MGPISSLKDASALGPLEFAIATSIFFRAKMRASAAPISPEPIMAYFIMSSLSTGVAPVELAHQLSVTDWLHNFVFSILVVCLIPNSWFRNLRYDETLRAVRKLQKYRDSLLVITISYVCAQWNYAISVTSSPWPKRRMFRAPGRNLTCRSRASAARSRPRRRNRFFPDDACPRRVVIQLAAAYAAAHSVASSSA